MDYAGKIINKTPVTPSQTSASGVWTLDDAAAAVKNNTWPIANVPNPISRSLRFNSADSTKLTRTPASAGNRKTWTFSAWVKRSALSSTQGIFHCYDGSSSRRASIQFNSDNTIGWDQGGDGSSGLIDTVAVYRDVSAWYHLVCVADYSNGTAANRAKIYINNVLQTVTTTDDFENADGLINSTNQHQIGSVDTVSYFNGYMTQIQFIDGQALDASYFGMTDPRTGAWISKPYTGTYGTNGFYLNFSDNTNTTTLGYDYSGNSNTWTTNNFSVTAGSGNDSMVDVPTNWIAYNTGDVGGVIRGNYCTWNPLVKSGSSNGNLTAATTNWATGTLAMPSSGGKYYFEITYDASTSSADMGVGIINQDNGTQVFSNGIGYYSSGGKYVEGVGTSYGASWGIGDTIGAAVNMDAGEITFYKNGASQGAISITSGKTGWLPNMSNGGLGQTQTATINAGQRPFAYTPPAGFKSLCTTNLPEPTILDGGDYMNVRTYDGNGGTQTVSGYGFQPDLIWIKSRSNITDHIWMDVLRGNYGLASNDTGAEYNNDAYWAGFTSDGFTVEGGGGFSNGSGRTYVAWGWDAGGTGVSNTAGTITSTVSANQTAGFSVITYSGNATDNATVGHGLGQPPKFLIWKPRNAVSDWMVWHIGLSGYNYDVRLNTTAAEGTGANPLNNTAPGSSVITLRNQGDVNGSGKDIVCYAFAPVEGYSAFGSYTGNGSSDGPFVYTGFRPAWVMVKRTDSSDNWSIIDTARETYNPLDQGLYANLSNAEDTGNNVDYLSNGFKVRNTYGTHNASGGTYIYAAFGDSFKFALGR